MDREASKAAPNGAPSDRLERLRLLVTLQNQIVELARRNQQAQQDCARLSREIARELERCGRNRGWHPLQLLRGIKLNGWWHWLRSIPLSLRPPEPLVLAKASVRSTPPGQAVRDQGPELAAAHRTAGAENKIEDAPPSAIRSATR
jgi:hypothetical protein